MGTNREGPGSNKGKAPRPEGPLRLIRSVEQDLLDKKYGIDKEIRVIPGNEPTATGKKPPRLIPEPGTDSTARYDRIPPPETEAEASARITRMVVDQNREREARGK